MKKNQKPVQHRQGDVLLIKMPDDFVVPDKAVLVGTENVILAYGEVTGHAHRIKDTTTSLYEWQGDQLVQVRQPTALTHEEHAPINLAPGIYKRIIQKEYVGEFESARYVVD